MSGAGRMDRVPIVTSIPPAMSRRTPDGAEIGSAYQAQCIDSWCRAGFEPVSVNSAAERQPDNATASQVRRITLQRDAREIVGKPLIYIHDLLRAAADLGPGPVVITNADILLEADWDLARMVGLLRPGEAIAGRRTDVRTPDDRVGRRYMYGFDFFAGHSKDLQIIPDFSLMVGVPWWDHFLPLALLAAGTRVHILREDFAWHLDHVERWNWPVWRSAGVAYARRLRSLLGDQASNPDDVRDVLQLLRGPLNGLREKGVKGPLSRFGRRLPWHNVHRRHDSYLSRTTEVTASFLEGRCAINAADLLRRLERASADPAPARIA